MLDSTNRDKLPILKTTILKNSAIFHTNKSEVERSINDYFTTKYRNNFTLLQQIQTQKKQDSTPMKAALESLRKLEIEFQQTGSLRTMTNPNKNHFNSTLQSGVHQDQQHHSDQLFNSDQQYSDQQYNDMTGSKMNQFNGTLQSNDKQFHLDLINSKAFIQNLMGIQQLVNGEVQEVPNFQGYWEILFEIQLEQYQDLINQPQTRNIVNEFLKYNVLFTDYNCQKDLVLGLVQCYLSDLHKRGIKTDQSFPLRQEMRGLMATTIGSCALYLSRLTKMQLQKNGQNVWLDELDTLLNEILSKNIFTYRLSIDLKKNNTIIDNLIQNCLGYIKDNLIKDSDDLNNSLKPIIMVCQHIMRSIKFYNGNKARMQIVNAVFISTTDKEGKVESPLKYLYQNSQHDQYQSILSSQFLNLKQPKSPFIDSKPSKEYTLVLDLDETLGHFSCNQFKQRPGLREFLQITSNYFEIIIFTAGMQEYADQILDQMDQDKLIAHRLYRQHTSFNQKHFIKDLTKLNRSLSKMIIIDNSPQNFSLQPQNGIIIHSWTDDPQDTVLSKMSELLENIAISKPNDTRKSLQRYRDYQTRLLHKGELLN